jgi:hypothetical protein
VSPAESGSCQQIISKPVQQHIETGGLEMKRILEESAGVTKEYRERTVVGIGIGIVFQIKIEPEAQEISGGGGDAAVGVAEKMKSGNEETAETLTERKTEV